MFQVMDVAEGAIGRTIANGGVTDLRIKQDIKHLTALPDELASHAQGTGLPEEG